MSELSKSGISTSITDEIKSGGVPSKTDAENVRTVLENINDSTINLVDAGLVVKAALGYDTTITPSDDKEFTTKKYVDEEVAGSRKEKVHSKVSESAPRINSDAYTCYKLTAQAVDITGFIIDGTPSDFQSLVIRIKCDSSVHNVTMGTYFVAMGGNTSFSLVANKTTHVVALYDSVLAKWGVTSVIQEA